MLQPVRSQPRIEWSTSTQQNNDAIQRHERTNECDRARIHFKPTDCQKSARKTIPKNNNKPSCVCVCDDGEAVCYLGGIYTFVRRLCLYNCYPSVVVRLHWRAAHWSLCGQTLIHPLRRNGPAGCCHGARIHSYSRPPRTHFFPILSSRMALRVASSARTSKPGSNNHHQPSSCHRIPPYIGSFIYTRVVMLCSYTFEYMWVNVADVACGLPGVCLCTRARPP